MASSARLSSDDLGISQKAALRLSWSYPKQDARQADYRLRGSKLLHTSEVTRPRPIMYFICAYL